jgi:hypothetical protein
MLQQVLIELYSKDLNKLIEELNLYKEEKSIWQVKDGISNSAGNLSLHLIGNLNHFIGTELGHTGYVRKRDDEFALKDIPRQQLIQNITDTATMIKTVLSALSNDDLNKDYPSAILGKVHPTIFILAYMASHLSYHLGQINYHRRLVA